MDIVSQRIEVVDRIRPPHDLSDEETEIWAAIVSVHPAEWFSVANAPLLVQFCRHTVHARRIGELIERMTNDLDIDEYDKLLNMQVRESRAIATLATKLRLTPQAITNHRGNKRPITSTPWNG